MKYNLMSKDNLIVPILEEEVQNSVSGESEAWGVSGDWNEHIINIVYCIYNFRNFNHVSLELCLVYFLYAVCVAS